MEQFVTMAHCVVGTSRTTDSTDNCEYAIIFE